MELIRKISREIAEYSNSDIRSDESAISLILSKKDFSEKGIGFGVIHNGFIYFNVPKQDWISNLMNLSYSQQAIKDEMKREQEIYDSLKEIAKEYLHFSATCGNDGFEITWTNMSKCKDILISKIHPKYLAINRKDFIDSFEGSYKKQDEFLDKIVNEVYLKK